MRRAIVLFVIVGACLGSQNNNSGNNNNGNNNNGNNNGNNNNNNNNNGQPGWDIGKTYTYQVQGHALSGLRAAGDYGGLQLKYKVKLTRQGQNQYYLQPNNFQVQSNCNLQCQDVPNRPIPQSVLQYLEAPIQYSMNQQGKVQAIKFDRAIPPWAQNFKKAQMAPFVANVQYPQQLTFQQQQQQGEASSYEQNEKTVYGQCDVEYQYQQDQDNNEQPQKNQYYPNTRQFQQNQQKQYENQQQQQQKAANEQQQKPWYRRFYDNNDSEDDDDDDDDDNNNNGFSFFGRNNNNGNGNNGNGNGNNNNNNNRKQQQNGQNQNRQNQNGQNQNGYNNYYTDYANSDENNSAQGFFSKLGRKFGGGSDSDESQEQNQNQGNNGNQNQYQAGQQPDDSDEEQEAYEKHCDQNDQKFQFTGMYKISDCNHTPNFNNASTPAQQRAFNKRQVFTRYYACGPNKKDYEIYHIERSEATKEAQEACQEITLLDISSASASARSQNIQQPSTFFNLAYHFNVQQQKHFPIVEMDKEQYQKQLQSQGGVGQILVYQQKDYQGQQTTVDVARGTCVGFPQQFNDQISSVDTQLSCVILWENNACSGRALRLERYSFGSDNLNLVQFDNKASSIQLC